MPNIPTRERPGVPTRQNMSPRNPPVRPNSPNTPQRVVYDPRRPQFSIFNYPGRPYGGESVRHLSEYERHVAQTYILRNCPLVQPYFALFQAYYELNEYDQEQMDKKNEEVFAKWFTNYVSSSGT